MTHFLPELQTTGVGSLPFENAEKALSFITNESNLTIPFWPQLPHRSVEEAMIPQYSEGMPCLKFDKEKNKLYFTPETKMEELENFYMKYLSEEPSEFAISEEYAAGLHTFINSEQSYPIVKGQITGPLTFSMGIKDKNDNPLFADAELREAVTMLLERKVQWQMEQLKNKGDTIIMSVDEPVLAAYGTSSYVGITEKTVYELEQKIFQAITSRGGITVIHVCGNSDWGVVIRSGVQFINFDAYAYSRSISIYAAEVKELFERGGGIAWGIVPTTEAILEESVESLANIFNQAIKALTEKGLSETEILQHSLLTPSCGAGSLKVEEAKLVFEKLVALQQLLQV